jgi:hypothetical protein
MRRCAAATGQAPRPDNGTVNIKAAGPACQGGARGKQPEMPLASSPVLPPSARAAKVAGLFPCTRSARDPRVPLEAARGLGANCWSSCDSSRVVITPTRWARVKMTVMSSPSRSAFAELRDWPAVKGG